MNVDQFISATNGKRNHMLKEEAMKFKIKTQDVDGSGSRSYATRAGAWKRFEEMSGHTPEVAIAEAFHAFDSVQHPTRDTVKNLRTVSDYGTVVIFFETN